MTDSRKVRNTALGIFSVLFLILAPSPAAAADGETAPARDPKQAIDEPYTAKIQKYTTASYFTSPLVNYLPASNTVPTPEAGLADFAGAPGLPPNPKHISKDLPILQQPTPR